MSHRLTSSEKADKENRYKDFNVVPLPYPGCEFFQKFREHSYTHEKLEFDWTQGYVDAEVKVPVDAISAQLNISWDNYKNWNIISMTQNYLKLCLKYLQESSKGLLIHCISGWDRTPLFVSLIRLSLWADGVIHQSLSALQVLYLTLAYDWYMFGHDLPDRYRKGEEIMVFCFYALKYIEGEEFSVVGQRGSRSKHNSSSSSGAAAQSSDTDQNLEGFLMEGGETRESRWSLGSCGIDGNPINGSVVDIYGEWMNG